MVQQGTKYHWHKVIRWTAFAAAIPLSLTSYSEFCSLSQSLPPIFPLAHKTLILAWSVASPVYTVPWASLPSP